MMNNARHIIFFGTGAALSVIALERLIELGYPPGAIVVPEYPAASNTPSLGEFMTRSTTSLNPLIKTAGNIGAPVVFAPHKVDSNLDEKLSEFDAEFILVVCWPYLLSEAVCATASKAALNLHPSLLPNYRGANPIGDQLQAGETRFGVSLHLLSPIFDAGDIIKQKELYFSNNEITLEQIEKQAARVGIDSFVESMNEFDSCQWQPEK